MGKALGLSINAMGIEFRKSLDKAGAKTKKKKAPGKLGKNGSIMDVNLPASAGSLEQRRILDALPALVFLERDGQIVFANAEARQMMGHAEEEWTPRPVEDVLWGLMPGTAEPQTQLAGTRRGSPFHATLPTSNGRLLAVEGTYGITNGELRESVIVAHPGGRGRAPKTRLMEDVLASIPEAVAIEHGGHVLYTNPAFTRMFGYTAEEAGGGSLRELIVPEERLCEDETLAQGVNDRGRVTVETVRRNKAGETMEVNLQMAPLLVDGARAGYVLTFRDAAECHASEDEIQHNALHDALTGLPNRALFLDHVNLALSRRARHPESTCGVLSLNLDRFREVNDALGHAAGDALLAAVAERLRHALRPEDSAARLGGDEFAVLVEDIAAARDLARVSERILKEMARPFDIFGHRVLSGACVGAAVAGDEHSQPEVLVREACQAMYRAKQAGGGCWELFGEPLAARARD
jgi:diguanylate cyclase (GGDEF)-like protein/PAS domain S-box-containing protein